MVQDIRHDPSELVTLGTSAVFGPATRRGFHQPEPDVSGDERRLVSRVRRELLPVRHRRVSTDERVGEVEVLDPGVLVDDRPADVRVPDGRIREDDGPFERRVDDFRAGHHVDVLPKGRVLHRR